MGRRRKAGSALRLKAVCDQFERWRRTRHKRTPIPQRLWDAAVKLTELYGISAVANALRLNHTDLKKRAEAVPHPPVRRVRRPGAKHNRGKWPAIGDAHGPRPADLTAEIAPPSKKPTEEADFVEVAWPALMNGAQWLVEMEEPGGAKLRICLRGPGRLDLAALSEAFWRRHR